MNYKSVDKLKITRLSSEKYHIKYKLTSKHKRIFKALVKGLFNICK